MTLPIVIPSPPSATASASSPSSDDSSSGPRTPVSPTTQGPTLPTLPNTAPDNANPSPSGATTSNGKRKPSRRANTAERRATHNAVERARRETLNGRFLDLAKMLPNLSQIRRPSKSAIVNSSIAHIHASRRHRALAARELRILKLETDHLRRELNEWRDRAAIPRVEEPVRSDGFSMVLNQELEVIPIVTSGGADDDDDTVGLYGEENGSVEGNDEEMEMSLSSGGPIGVEEQQRMMLAVGGRPSPPALNTSIPPYPQQHPRPPFHHTHPQPLIAPVHGSYDGYSDYPSAGMYPPSPNEKYSNPQMQQYLESLNIARRRSQSGRDRSNSMASMTSSGSASPPLYPSHPHHPAHFPEAGWVGVGLGHHPHQTMQIGGGGIGNGVSFAMM